MNLHKKFPCVADMRGMAAKRVPKFAFDYLAGGIGSGISLKHNRDALDRIRLMPRYLVSDADNPDCSTQFLGQKYDRPFGVAPVGLGGLIWPGVCRLFPDRLGLHQLGQGTQHSVLPERIRHGENGGNS